jgi:methylamine dehydrogenase heavy chain
MRVITLLVSLALVAPLTANAQIAPQTLGPPEKMPPLGKNWFIAVSNGGGYIFDATSGEMHGMLRTSGFTPAIQPSADRSEFYAAASYYARGTYGERTDTLSIQDYENLSAVAEVEIPKKIAALPFRGYIGLMSGGNHVGVSNLTPAQSVTIVDVANRRLVGEISTPGCSLVLPVENNDFLTMCGDGTLMLVQLDDAGRETNRVRSRKFFELEDDPVYDRPVETADGWLLLSNNGKAFEVDVSGSSINISQPWNFVTEEDAEDNWWPGGNQLLTVQRRLGLFYVTMHQGERYSHHEAGTEIWVFSLAGKHRVARMELDRPASSIMVTQEDEPLLIVGGRGKETRVYDALTFVLQREIDGPPAALFEDL